MSALVPRPRLHLIRCHGLPARHAKQHLLTVPQVPPQAAMIDSEQATAAMLRAPIDALRAHLGPCSHDTDKAAHVAAFDESRHSA